VRAPAVTRRHLLNHQCSYFSAYYKTPTGHMVKAYTNMSQRVRGVQKKYYKYYKDLPILSRQDFYRWTKRTRYMKLWKAWADSGYQCSLSPSIDRIDSSKGYVIGNMQWITKSDNSKRIKR